MIPAQLLELLVIINPLDKFFVMLFLGKDLSKKDMGRLLHITAISCVLISLFFIVTGPLLLELFHVKLPTLRTVGGILVFYLGFNVATKGSKRVLDTKAEGVETLSTMLAFPLSTGPGFITVLLTLVADPAIGRSTVLGYTLAALAVLFVVMYVATRIAQGGGHKKDRKGGFVISFPLGSDKAYTEVTFDLHKLEFISRFVAVLICCIGLQMTLGGLQELVPGLFN
ncbi:MAG: MarC family protein [Candidatus Undinarchaeales archaeon]|jgi:multiple antibiotic resistance protein|nr:MarC family protein [Candidatus Undinarchaeales archaeon]MDP7491390.1 MarC family protein [Candidatus Undinarchaeales archaeon]